MFQATNPAREMIRVDSFELSRITTFSTHPQSLVGLHFPSIVKIDFRYDESTARETIILCELCGHQRGFLNRLPVSRTVNFTDESTLVGCIRQPSTIHIIELLHG